MHTNIIYSPGEWTSTQHQKYTKKEEEWEPVINTYWKFLHGTIKYATPKKYHTHITLTEYHMALNLHSLKYDKFDYVETWCTVMPASACEVNLWFNFYIILY